MATVQQSIAQYPKGFTSGVTVRGVPLLNSYSGNIWWVDAAGAQTGDGKFNRPFATIDTAINSASTGDIILVKAGHTETLVAAGAITMDVAGVSIIGLGTGNNRPVITCTPAAVGTNNITWSAANCSFENMVVKPGLDAITNPFNISAAGAYLDIEWQDASATVEAETVVLTTAAGDNLTVKLAYRGFTAGDACVAPIKLVGCTDGRIDVDFYGKASTAVVNFITTLSTNITVKGYVYNSGTTDGSKLVVDTITGSLWYAEIQDGAAGAKFSGGSGAALASDDVSTVAANVLVPAADVTTNTAARDVVGNKTDAAVTTVGTTKSIIAYTKGLLNQIGTITNTGGTADIGSIVGDFANSTLANRVPRRTAFAKADVTAGTGWTTANSPVTVATVTGVVLCRVFGHVTTAITSTGGTGTLALGVSDNVALWIAATTADATNFATNDVWVGPTTTTKGNLLNNTSGWALVSNDTIKVTIATNNMTAGGMTIYVEWMPVSAGATVA